MGFKIEKLVGVLPMQNIVETCANCGEDNKCRRRDFSEQAWTALLVWGEIQKTTVDQAICENCYDELRETLIDRHEDIVSSANQPIPTQTRKPAASAAKPAAVAKPAAKSVPVPGAKPGAKVRKAG